MGRTFPMTAFCMYIIEKHKQSVYKEDCLWLMSQPNMVETQRHLLIQPYIRRIKKESQQAQPVPTKSLDETIDYIFEDI